MAAKMKGICKGIKCMSHIFVVKDREIEIGYPTDVKHLAHIGLDRPGSGPSWMNEFKRDPAFSASSIGNNNQLRVSNSRAVSTWPSEDHQQVNEMFKDLPPTEPPKVPRKYKRKKNKSTSSSNSSSSRSSRSAKLKAKCTEAEAVVDF